MGASCFPRCLAAFATSPMLAGISGLGHMILTAAFVLFFLILRRAISGTSAQGSGGSSSSTLG